MRNYFWFPILIFLGCKNDIQRPSILTLFFPTLGNSEKLAVVTSDFSSGGRLSIIDTGTLIPAPTLSLIHSDAVLRYTNGRLYVINRLNRDSILVLNPSSYFTPEGEVSVGRGNNPQDIAILNGKIYVSLYEKNYLLILNSGNFSTIGTIDLSPYVENSGLRDELPESGRMMIYGGFLYLQVQRLDRNDASGFPSPTNDSFILKLDPLSDRVISVIKTPAANPLGKMQVFIKNSIPHLAVCLPSRLGFISRPDGGIGALNLNTDEFLGEFLYREDKAGGDILDMVIKNETEGYAFVLDAGFNKQIHKFNPSTGEKLSVLASYPSSLGNISGLALSSDGKLFLGDAGFSQPGITVYDTNSELPRKLNETPIDVGLRPFELEILR